MKLTGGFWCIEWCSWFRLNGRLLGLVCFWMKSTVYSSGQYDSTLVSNETAARLRCRQSHYHGTGTVHKSVVLSLPTDLMWGFTLQEFCDTLQYGVPISKRADFQLQMLHFMHKSTCHVQNAWTFDLCFDHGIQDMVTTRVGFVLSDNVTMQNINYQGIDTIRPSDNGALCGGGAFETKGCAENDCKKSSVNNGGSETRLIL